MPTWDELRTARRAGSLAAQRTRRRLGLAAVRRIDIFEVIDAEGIWLMFQPLHDLHGFYRRLGDTAGIVINAGNPPALQRYTAAHEFAHHVLGHAFSLDEEAAVSGGSGVDGTLDASHSTAPGDLGDPLQEAAAQAFAATFLMPIQMVNLALVDAGHDRDRPALTAADVYALSLEFGTSYEAMLIQLAVLGKISWAQVRDLRLPPIRIKMMLGGGRRPDDARADLWPVHDRDRDRSFPLRVGDEFLIHLPEIPSSGYAWELRDGSWSALELVEQRLAADADEEDALGGGAQRTLRLRAVAPGVADVTLELARPWEDLPADRATFHVAVAQAPTGDAPFGLLERQQRRRVEVA